MQSTSRLLGPPGFWKRSLQELRRNATTAVKFEAVKIPTRPFPLIYFSDPNSITLCKRMSDADLGAFSTSNLDFVPASNTKPSHAQFHGTISTALPPDNPEVVRTGYAGWRTLDMGPTIFGRSLWDLSPYTCLALRIKSDGRKYFVNLQTDSVVATDLHQHRLFTKKSGQWETVVINLRDFVRTNHGMVVEPQSEMLTEKVKSVGISLTDRIPEPYSLSIARVWATNVKGDETLLEDDKPPTVDTPSRSVEKILI
ncbi:complex I intermediate-associated protein 30, mitochondrial precursor [Tothia fuscella]|uniref:Complex I intermediate-associated protein 30, mitochondrial n=1 Tax=Tothia fuscella TaxID=1048955 RepID=A0A9P4U0P8_9PEZI|nr:complex I intermediate-associated protein 30, mitochondrial precursor [Tothia fuscella]